MIEIPLIDLNKQELFKDYKNKFKALADEKRLEILHLLTTDGESCVCDLQPKIDMTQSKLSYHLKILLDADLITRTTKGTWSYYKIKEETINHILSEELCCIFRPSRKKDSDTCC
ncbi:ArsR family transcriptional regulator [Salirhabdus euzebyi]|uniref:ArsR family transcriptional regulator n=1 Tax=Salirhabdus euzebyi TaxID=394506 RepID=A0A841Q4P7_9BACI|nr:metalloregulator ArsR/SmtB family transcription factor [Salirhabdus euzebyi]MBB6453333.1 ArsR family transcriptional regulator [Salirhabdus euzebyi]